MEKGNLLKNREIEIQPDVKDPRFLILLLKGSPWKRVYKSLFVKYLRELSSVDLEEAEQTFYRIELKVAKALAVKWLAQKSYFSEELSAKLQDRGISPRAITEALHFCKGLGALNDRKQLEELVAREIQRGHGPFWIEDKLRRMGMGSSKDLEVLFQNYAPLQEEVIWKLIKRKVKLGKPLQRTEQHKLLLFLMRKGFSKESILNVLQQVLSSRYH